MITTDRMKREAVNYLWATKAALALGDIKEARFQLKLALHWMKPAGEYGAPEQFFKAAKIMADLNQL